MQKTGAEAFTRSGTCLVFKLAVSFSENRRWLDHC